ncbi:hypothetical protein U9M48_027626 [Paspalum notatum var. saurae]|uniref:Uncharacterized protein n=1 Tax=Paspalum notatum var. saurae TaxID=547442 RepID=A0AAQ3TV43_PASNO
MSLQPGRRRDVSKRLAKLSIEPVDMKRSKRIACKKKINYASLRSAREGPSTLMTSDYPDDDHEEVSSVHVVPSIDTYHPGGGDGQRCCTKCREAIRALLRKNSDTFTVIDDLEDRLSTEMIGIRRDVENFSRRMKGEVSFMLREMQHLNNARRTSTSSCIILGIINQMKFGMSQRLKNQLSTKPGEDPLDDPEDGWEWDNEDE